MKEKLHREQMREANQIAREKQAQEEKAKHTNPSREHVRRDWARYNEAEVREHQHVIKVLLPELCKVGAERMGDSSIDAEYIPQKTGRGRPKLKNEDILYCAILKVYSNRASRYSAGLMEMVENMSIINRAPHFNAISKFLNREDVTVHLRDMLRLSALPLSPLETKFAIDSSGFRTTAYNSWMPEKHRVKVKNVWLKAHIASGVLTNIITDAKITDGNASDVLEFRELLGNTMEIFDAAEVYADKGYIARYNLQFAEDRDIAAFIPFRKSDRSLARGSPAWYHAHQRFTENPEEFYSHYHLRSNVETTFSCIKEKLGETLKSKNKCAQINELYCKLIAYNLTVVNKAMLMYEVQPDFLSVNLRVENDSNAAEV
ncbi:transposase [Methanorbis furvi]